MRIITRIVKILRCFLGQGLGLAVIESQVRPVHVGGWNFLPSRLSELAFLYIFR